MIYIYGDSHAHDCFKNLKIPFIDLHLSNKTMHSIGRDKIIVNYDRSHHTDDSIIILSYGEIDCRCHIQKQINIGFDEDIIINTLVYNYFEAIKYNLNKYKLVIIVAVIPPTEKDAYEKINGPITHNHPFVGSDEDRARYTKKVNEKIEEFCRDNKYIYFDPYEYYRQENGCLKYEYSDNTVHLKDTDHFLKEFNIVLEKNT